MFHTDLTPFGIDMDRLAAGRLSRLQDAMAHQGLGAMILTDQHNIRYATNTVFMHGLRATAIQRFVIVPAAGLPLICQRETSRKRKDYRAARFDAFMFGMRPAVATQDFADETLDALNELGIIGEP